MKKAGKKFPMVIAHRGFSGRYPENTAAALEAAIRLGVESVEIDVHETRDGRIVVFHDYTLQRMCGVNSRVCDLTFAELRRKKSDLPTLEHVLKLCRGKARVLLEIKKADAMKVAEIVEFCGMGRQTSILTGSLATLKILAKSHPKIARSGLIRGDLAKSILKMRGLVESVAVDRKLIKSRSVVAKIQASGCAVFVWTVNQEIEMRRLISLGVDGLITNFPDRAIALRGQHGQQS